MCWDDLAIQLSRKGILHSVSCVTCSVRLFAMAVCSR